MDGAPDAIRAYMSQVALCSEGDEINASAEALAVDARVIFFPRRMAGIIDLVARANSAIEPLVADMFVARLPHTDPLPFGEALQEWTTVSDEVARDLTPTVQVSQALSLVRRAIKSGANSSATASSFGKAASLEPATIGQIGTTNADDAIHFVLAHEYGHHLLNHINGKASRPPYAAPGNSVIESWRVPTTRVRPVVSSALRQELDADEFAVMLTEAAINAYLSTASLPERYLKLARGAMLAILTYSLIEQDRNLWARSRSHPSFAMRAEQVLATMVERVETYAAAPIDPGVGVRLRVGHPALGVVQAWITTRVIAQLVR